MIFTGLSVVLIGLLWFEVNFEVLVSLKSADSGFRFGLVVSLALTINSARTVWFDVEFCVGISGPTVVPGGSLTGSGLSVVRISDF